jgi:hypothetical protein
MEKNLETKKLPPAPKHDLTVEEYRALGAREICRRLLRHDVGFKRQVNALVSAGRI